MNLVKNLHIYSFEDVSHKNITFFSNEMRVHDTKSSLLESSYSSCLMKEFFLHKHDYYPYKNIRYVV